MTAPTPVHHANEASKRVAQATLGRDRVGYEDAIAVWREWDAS